MDPAVLDHGDVAAFLQARKRVVKALDKLAVLANRTGLGSGAVACRYVDDGILRDNTVGVLVVPGVSDEDISLATLEVLARFVLALHEDAARQIRLIGDSLDKGFITARG